MSRLLGSTGIDIEQQFSVFSEGSPDIVDQTGQVILVDEYPLFFHAVLETGDIEALVGLHVVENSVAVFEPDCLFIAVSVFVAGGAHPGGKLVQQRNQPVRFNEAGGMYIPNFFHRPKALAHGLTSLFRFFRVSMIRSGALSSIAMSVNLGVATLVRDAFFHIRTV
jgi:hypothetical protein